MASEMSMRLRTAQSQVWWNLLLLTAGAMVFAIGYKGVAFPHGFISGGLFGTGMLMYYSGAGVSPSFWYMVLNAPIFVLGWYFMGRRFFWYSIYGVAVTTLASQFININLGIQNPMLAAVATGFIFGAGGGIVLRSLGSDGGLTIASIILHQRYGIRVGQTHFVYNLVLFALALSIIHIDRVLYSMIIVFIASGVMDSVGSMFNQRKMALIVSDQYENISADIMKRLGRGVTYLHGEGAFTRTSRVVLLTVVQSYQIKRLEELVFQNDPDAFVIIENTFNVLGTGFSSIKKY